MRTSTSLALALALTTTVAATSVIGGPSPREDARTGWSRVAELHNRDSGAEFGDGRLAEAERLLAEAVENRTSSDETVDEVPFNKSVQAGDECTVSCGNGCGYCSASASCDKPACSCECSCKQVETCTDCGWCGCDWCGEEKPKYACQAACSGVGGSLVVSEEVTIDGENDFTPRDFAAWTDEEDGDITTVAGGLVTVATKDLAGRLVTGNALDLALETWADLLVDFARWANP